MFSLGLAFMLFILRAHSAVLNEAEKPSCSELYYLYDMSDNFNETIAHTIHSMTVQGLRMFNPRATKENNVPTINHDVSDEVFWIRISFLIFSFIETSAVHNFFEL